MKYWLGIVIILIIASCSTAPVNPPAGNKVDIYDMTNRTVNNLVLIYFAAGNNLEPNAVQDFYEIELAVSSLRAKGDDVMVYIDFYANKSSFDHYIDQNYYPEITSAFQNNANYLYPGGVFDPQGIDGNGMMTAKRVYTNKNNNTGDPACLDEFLDFVKSKYSYSHVFLVLWNHGSSIFPMGTNVTKAKDETPYKGLAPLYIALDEESEDSLSDEEVKYAISNSLGRVDALAFDACIMGNIEVAYEYRNICDYFIASPNYVPTDGYPYDTWLITWAQSSSNDINSMAKLLCDKFQAYYIAHDTPYYECLYSMKMPEGADQLTAKLNSLAGYIKTSTNVNKAWIMMKYESYPDTNSPRYRFDYPVNCDTYTIDRMFQYIATNSGNGAVITLAADVSNIVKNYVYASTNNGCPTLFYPVSWNGAKWFLSQGWYSPDNLKFLLDNPEIKDITTGEDWMINEKTEGMFIDWTEATLLDWSKAVKVKKIFYLDNPDGVGGFANYVTLSNSLIRKTNAVHKCDVDDHYYKVDVATGGVFQLWIAFDSGYEIWDYYPDSVKLITVYNSGQSEVVALTVSDVRNNIGGAKGLNFDTGYIVKNGITNDMAGGYNPHNISAMLSAGQYYIKVTMIGTFGPEFNYAPYLMWLGSNNTCTFN
jgi:hypothetical protein